SHPKRSALACLGVGMLTAAVGAAADVSGEWEFAAKYLADTNYARVTLKVNGDKLTGTLNELKVQGTVTGDELTFNAKRPNGDQFGDFTGKAKGDSLEGTAVWFGERKVEWFAKRPATPPQKPRLLDFEPKEFHRV